MIEVVWSAKEPWRIARIGDPQMLPGTKKTFQTTSRA
jgi:hypothetical protein